MIIDVNYLHEIQYNSVYDNYSLLHIEYSFNNPSYNAVKTEITHQNPSTELKMASLLFPAQTLTALHKK